MDRLGLDRVYSTPWFAVLLFAFSVSLTLSTYEQIKNSARKTFGMGIAAVGRSFRSTASEESVIRAIRKRGYMLLTKDRDIMRFVKHPWGYWGNLLFHLGIFIVIISSLLIVLTQKRGLIHLVEGETYMPGNPWVSEEKGILTGQFMLPMTVRLDKVLPEFWETDDLKQLMTIISFGDHQGNIETHTLAINRINHYKGLRVYQGQTFGATFFVELKDDRGRTNGVRLQIDSPARREEPSYLNYRSESLPYLLKAKYFADAERRSLISTDPLLIMRLVDKGSVIAELTLRNGETGKFGPYTARLVKALPWAGIIFVDMTGMPGIFLGFFVIISGVCLTYFAIPREFVAKRIDEGFQITWKTTKFETFYEQEYNSILSSLSSNGGNA